MNNRVYTGRTQIDGFSSLRNHLKRSAEIYRRYPSLPRSVYRFSACSLLLAAVVSIAISRRGGAEIGWAVMLWTAPVIALYALFVLLNLALLRSPDGRPASGLQTANALTAARIFLVAPILVLLSGGERILGTILYAIAALTDIVDGYIARRLGQESVLGVMLDPVGDIASTAAVCVYLWREGLVPTWLFALLIVRYAQFFAGLALLALFGAAPRLGATIAGKVVGTVQAIGIILLLGGSIFPAERLFGTIREYAVPVLGVAFGSVIVSQTVIGGRSLRARHATEQGVS